MEHLLWSFELGWFVVNAVVVANVGLTERFGSRAAWPVAALCTFASLASAQGAFAFFAAALHQGLLPARPGRRAAAASLAVGGLLAMAHLFWREHASTSAPRHPDHAWGGMAVFAIELLGGLFGLHGRAPLLAGGCALLVAAALLIRSRVGTARPDRLRCAATLMSFSALCLAAFARGRHHLGIDWATTSFHAAPLLVPFALGLAVLLRAPPVAGRGGAAAGARRSAGAPAALLLGLATATAVPHGLTRARLWVMDLGYARWAACSGEVPEVVAARGSGVGHDLAGFEAVRPTTARMCAALAGPLEAALVRRPALFDALAAARPEAGPALDALWQGYVTSPKLQLAIKPWRADTPARLLAFAAADAAEGSVFGSGLLAPHATAYRALAP